MRSVKSVWYGSRQDWSRVSLVVDEISKECLVWVKLVECLQNWVRLAETVCRSGRIGQECMQYWVRLVKTVCGSE